MKKTLKQRMTLTIISIASLFIMVVTVTFSWYTARITAESDLMTVRAATAQNLKVSANNIDFDNGVSLNANEDYKLTPICSNGKMVLEASEYDPYGKVLQKEGEYVIYGEKPIKYNVVSEDIFDCECVNSFEFSIMSVADSALYIDSSSSVTPARNEIFSDNIAAAVRVGIFKMDSEENYELVAIWIPNPCHQIKFENGNPYVDRDGEVEEYYVFPESISNGIIEETRIETNDEKQGCVLIDSDDSTLNGVTIIWGTQSLNSASFKTFTNIGIGLTKFKFVVWIDGNDRECSSNTSGTLVEGEDGYSLVDSEVKFDIRFGSCEVNANE